MLENGYETLHDGKGHRVLQDDYELTVIQKYEKGCRQDCVEHPWLERKIIFGRTDLKPHRQVIYDEDGQVATDAQYAEYKDYDGFSFPSRIEIFRPQEEYDITLNMLKVDINKPLTDDQFVLEQPPGAHGDSSGPSAVELGDAAGEEVAVLAVLSPWLSSFGCSLRSQNPTLSQRSARRVGHPRKI